MFKPMFGRKTSPSAAAQIDRDSDLLHLLSGRWQCACCGEWHEGVMDLAAHAPGHWQGESDYEPNSDLWTDGDFLSEDFCVIGGQDFLVRSVLEIPVHGLDEPWGFGCWASLSRADFDDYVNGFDDGRFEEDAWSGWLANRIKIYFEGRGAVKVDVVPQPGRQRPRLYVQDEAHPLAIAQRDGIASDALLQLLRAYGHAPALQ